MVKNLLWISGLLLTQLLSSQNCPVPEYPKDGDTGVPVDVTLNWTAVTGVTAYNITIGTTPGGSEIVSSTSTGQNTSFTPPQGLPENSTIYVTLSVFILSQGSTTCTEYNFTTENVTTPPQCTIPVSPQNGAINVPISSAVRWVYSPTATGYRLYLGTSPTTWDVADGIKIEQGLQWTPNIDLLPEQTYYFRVIPYNENGEARQSGNTLCELFEFTTGVEATLPACPVIKFPEDGAFNVPLSPILTWESVAGADGYRISLGTSPQNNDILNRADLRGNTETGVLDFDANRIYYLTLTAYNEAGESQNCFQTSFSTLEGCGPYIDEFGELRDLHPPITPLDTIGICSNKFENIIEPPDEADGYRWYSLSENGTQNLLSESPEFNIPAAGTYKYEIYNNYIGLSGDFECSSSVTFVALVSERPTIVDAKVQLNNGTLSVEVLVNGNGNFVYSVDNYNGPYQNSNRFTGLSVDRHTIYVRDKNGCGEDDIEISPDLAAAGFPAFFTPNGDGVNETWNYVPNPISGLSVREIAIFDRQGKLLAKFGPGGLGWDGNYGGNPMPESDYWFSATTREGDVITGHFTLKR
jgi:gliding motility-associated-like protein